MIAKVGVGKSFKGLSEYLHKGTKEEAKQNDFKKAEVIDSFGVRNYNPKVMAYDFHQHSKLNKRMSKPVGHDSLSFAYSDSGKMSNELMKEVSNKYMEKMGYDKTQYAVIRHKDRKHDHCHIVFNRVKQDHSTIRDNKKRAFKAHEVCRGLEKEYNLEKVKSVEQNKEIKREEKLKGIETKRQKFDRSRDFAKSRSLLWEKKKSRLATKKQGKLTMN